MQIRTSLSIWSTTFFASLGLTPLTACGGVSRDGSYAPRGDAGSGGNDAGGAESSHTGNGGTATGGTGTATGGTGTATGGTGTATGGTGAATGGTGAGGYSATGGRASGGSFPDSAGGRGTGGTPSLACRNPRPRLDANGQPTGFVDCDGGVTHRAVKQSCPSSLPRPGMHCPFGTPPVFDGMVPIGSCVSDADCTASPNGYCGGNTPLTVAQPSGCYCQYGCTRDEDCGPGHICECGDPVGQCMTATCAVDADCGTRLCLGNQDGPCGATTFGCQQLDDTCFTNLDCTPAGSSPPSICTLSMGVRTCAGSHPCGTGRPFLVGGAARVAGLAERRDWSASISPTLDGLDQTTRVALAERWTAIALMEHASIAAFSRFALELLGMGAPPELLLMTQAAMLDETVHARDAFALASAYAGRAVGPGALDSSGALADRSPLDVVRTAILEGCIGETVAAVEAAEAVAHATDPTVRQVLERVTVDETRHAELAWRFLRWVLEHGDPELRNAAVLELATVVESECAASRAASIPAAGYGPALREHGIIEDSARIELRGRILAEIIAPCAQALAATASPGLAAAA